MDNKETKTALITGSYGGLGSCFASLHASLGGDLVLVGRNEQKLLVQAQEIKQLYKVAIATIVADLSQPDAPQAVYDTCRKQNLQIDYLINNAGFGGRGDFTRERSLEQDMQMIAVNIEAPTRLCKLFLKDFVARGSGKVLNVSSTAASMPGPLQAVYYATKAYLTSWSNALWRELKDTGVTVTALMPGPMQTGFADTADLLGTKLFAAATQPENTAKEGYEAMLRGDINVVSGMPGWQKAFVAMAPMMPTKAILNFVFDQQSK